MDTRSPQETLVYIGRMLFERRLTDFCGGNISLRVGETIYISPRYSGSSQHWNLDPNTVVVGDIRSDEVLHAPSFSREGKAHLGVYRAYSEAKAIIHAHAFYVLPFCAAGKPIPPVLESTEKFGEIALVSYAPSHSQDLADAIVKGFETKRSLMAHHSAAVLIPRHGLFAVSKDIFSCLDAVERINWNAWCILAQKMMPDV